MIPHRRTLPLLLLTLAAMGSSLHAQYEKARPSWENPIYQDAERWIRERARWFYEQRAYPLGYIPDGQRERAWIETKRMSAWSPSPALSKQLQTAASTWTLAGPSNIGGRITGIAVDPVHTQTVYFTAADGGVWKSTDGGTSFVPVTDDLATQAMGSIAVAPSDPNVLYAGTGEANFSADSYPGIGVIKSTDAGATWSIAGTKISGYIGRIAVHPANSGIVLAATRNGLYRTTNGGANWTQTASGTVTDVAINPANPDIVYAGVQTTGVIKSSDGGVTWNILAGAAPGAPKDSIGRVALDICGGTPSTVYAVVVRSSGGSLQGVYKTTNGGVSWTRTAISPNFFGTQGWYDVSIGVNPLNANQVFIGGVPLYMSSDGGVNWSTRSSLHVDQHAFEFDPSNPQIAYAGSDGGLFKTTNGGSSFSSRNQNLPITQFYELGVFEQNPSVIGGGTQDNGTNRGTGTQSWTQISGGDGGYCVFDYSNASVIYTEYQNGSHLKSTNGGASFSPINRGLYGNGLWVTPVVMHPTDPQVLFTATSKQLYKTTNGGALWFAFNGSMDSSSAINAIAISRGNPDVMLAGKINGRIYASTDAGATWNYVSTGLPNKTCTDVAVDPSNPAVYYATYSGSGNKHVFKSTNAGTQWIDITGNLPDLPTNCLEINPWLPGTLYVGTDFGVFISTNGGTSWQTLMDGMPKAVVVDLEIHRASGLLRAATHGRSVYQIAIALSVELSSFTAQIEGPDVLLNWRTQTETNNRGFSLERRTGPDDPWTEIAFVPGSGTVSYPNYYTYRDPIDGPLRSASEIFYRFKQVDYDGSFEYSPEVRVLLASSAAEDFSIQDNYPNPFSEVTTIRYSLPSAGHASLRILNCLGQRVALLADDVLQPGAHLAHFDATDLPEGTYFAELAFGGRRLVRRLIYLK